MFSPPSQMAHFLGCFPINMFIETKLKKCLKPEHKNKILFKKADLKAFIGK